MKGTCMASRYSSVANLVASATLLQSISQNRADTVVVKLTQSRTNVRGVDPVTSSHWARVVPPRDKEISGVMFRFVDGGHRERRRHLFIYVRISRYYLRHQCPAFLS